MSVLDQPPDPAGLTLPPPAPGHTPPPISFTFGDLPRRQAYRPYRLTLPDGSARHLVVFTEDLYSDRLEHAYLRNLHGPARLVLWSALRIPNPDLDPVAYSRARWWRPDTRIDRDLIRRCEAAGMAHPWNSAAERVGPLLGPPRA
ncbi:hypothetical protein Q8791_28895 [Nocardiopsis sp. CT-R113]|uniref:Uncharacterized protein n=1 Tax=Nocardiopsis codii TaxID=3065942 RepID=A0ABU7KH58_9ACTN|nr:hypothetical protein [Nocardiopsis sp. CT-R113]MEE2041249.1 hypothetical protein [Nocardiopsis sp. CT-R113]